MTETPTTTSPTALTFAQGTARQAAGLSVAAGVVQDWLAEGRADALRTGSMLLVGIGASDAATATPTHVLRSHGFRAYRSTGGDLPAGAPAMADHYVGVSQSGRSRETIQALSSVPKENRFAVVNNPDSPLARMSGAVLHMGNLQDSRMSSVAFSATVLTLGMMVDHLVAGTPDPRWGELGEVADAVVAEADDELADFAHRISSAGMVDVVGRAASLTAAQQGALLFREGPFLPSTFMDTRSYLHGPMDCAGPTSHVVLGRDREGLLVDQLAERDAPTLLITDRPVRSSARTITIPDLPDCQRSVVEVALLQRLVIHVGQILDRDIDSSVFRRLDTKIDSTAELAGANW